MPKSKLAKTLHPSEEPAWKNLPKWADTILQWRQYQMIGDVRLEAEEREQARIDSMNFLQKLIRGFPAVDHTISGYFYRLNPIRQPSLEAIEKFKAAYPDVAQEWDIPPTDKAKDDDKPVIREVVQNSVVVGTVYTPPPQS